MFSKYERELGSYLKDLSSTGSAVEKKLFKCEEGLRKSPYLDLVLERDPYIDLRLDPGRYKTITDPETLYVYYITLPVWLFILIRSITI